MEKVKKIFGGINLTWKKLIIFAIIAGIYTAVMAIIPIAKNTSFADITITFEVWILFGIIIIMNSKSAKDSALKCFVFFLISQPLVYLIQVPFASMGWGLFNYYQYWFMWTVLTIPMGFVGYFMKKDKWWGLIILAPILVLLGFHYKGFLGQTLYNFPYHLLSTIFCFVTLIIYPICIFKDKKIRILGAVISIAIIAVMTFMSLLNNVVYNTTVLVNEGKTGAKFNNDYQVYLTDESFGRVYIVYEEAIEDYMVNAEFVKGGITEIVLEAPNGEKQVFEIEVKQDTYEITPKNNNLTN